MNPQQVFVIIERHVLPQTTLMKSIDSYYKTIFVFNLEYQKAYLYRDMGVLSKYCL
ncbi:hypothetical protein HOLleu_10307 [Holothuria leucospilota]|uniref:Uncharacterized protein n=1 Tax=Holothuria leucospilota TaxID=206669 RepID=A0A9Q1CEK2_HOLLE|nr:hypothetical protein HOLleu_10307 [Holothuria leucospilota]